MISHEEVNKLLSVRADGPSVLSLYLWVPLDPAALRGLRPAPVSCSPWPPAAAPARRG